MTSPLAVVTGASSGLGAALARVLAEEGHDLLLVARRVDRLDALGEALHGATGVRCTSLGVDLGTDDAAATVADAVLADGRPTAVLVNNAGYYLDGDFLEHPWDAQRSFLNVMVGTPTALVHRLLPAMLAAGAGRVITMASLGGLLHSTPHQTLYGPSKRFGIALSRGLAREYAGTGVTFTAVCPGFTRTEMMDHGATARAGERVPGFLVADADHVARRAWRATRAGRPVVVTGAPTKVAAAALRVLPTRWGDRLMAATFERLTAPR